MSSLTNVSINSSNNYQYSLAISPWNSPLYLSLRAIVAPILCGNTVILKSSEYTPACQAIVAEAFHDAGLPPGVLNYITMAREDAPKLIPELIAHPAVKKINVRFELIIVLIDETFTVYWQRASG